MRDRVKAKDKVENPKAQFDKPKEIVQDKALSQHEKKKALNTWEQDERQLLTASNEGMPVELTLSDRTHSGLRLCSDVLAG
jgi:hypothetical protein